ncbi:MAG: ATP-binding protein [Planctomycetes bacterium]|nr:ATP-binding protein [Planctomycetota bacterium]
MPPPRLNIDVPADASYLKCIRGFVKPVLETRFEEDVAGQIVLAVDEACSNIIKHGQSWLRPRGRIILELEDGKKRITFRISNFCKESEVDKIKPRDLDDVKPGGLGTHFMKEVMDTVEFEPDTERSGRVALVMTKTVCGKNDHEAQS